MSHSDDKSKDLPSARPARAVKKPDHKGKTVRERRETRLAQALRANLRRRKGARPEGS